MIYLDYNATAPMKPAVRVAMLEAMERHGNPSSVHRYGRIARRYVEEARAAIAALAGVKASQVVFTSGGTEANNMVFHGQPGRTFFTSSIEHDSVLSVSRDAVRLPVLMDGTCDLNAAELLLKAAPSHSVISLMLVNNETGIVQPVSELSRIARRYGHRMHTDAVQAAGRIPLDFAALDVDFMTLSSHKIGGPQGMGALIMREGITLEPLMRGGGQEMFRRPGTENVAGIIGFGVAAQLSADDLIEMPKISAWRDHLQKEIQSIGGDNAVVIGTGSPRVGNTLSVAMRAISSETQVAALDLGGVAVSAGSACSSGKVRASHVLRAMGYGDEIASSALRISIGWNTAQEELSRCAEAWRQLFERKNNLQRVAAA